jgi:hypothetical protein
VELLSPILVPFLIPLLVVAMMITIQGLLLFVGIGLDFDGDADHDFDLDADVDADVDVDVDVDVDAGIAGHAGHGVFDIDHDHDHDFDHGHDFDHDAAGWSFGKLLSPLGVGKIPLSIVWETYFLGFGISGVTLSFLLSKFFAASFWFLGATIPLSLVFGWHITKLAAKAVVPLLKTSGVAESERDIVGRIGKVTSLGVDNEWGEVELNVNGSINHMIVVTDGDTLGRGDQVVVTDYDSEKKRPIVTRLKA